MIYTVEVTGYNVTTLVEDKFYFSTGAFITKPSDTPANTAFLPRVVNPGSVGVHLYADGKTSGNTRLEVGELIISNIDGAYDYLNIAHNFGGRDIIIRYGDAGASYPSSFTTVFKGTCDSIEITRRELIFRLKDKSYLLDQPLITATYGGTNTLPDGIDGTADDIKGDIKPKLYGSVFNATPVCVNTSKLIYQINNGNFNTVTAVYDRGNAITFGVDRATNALLQSNAPAALTYDTCKAEGLIRLGTSPGGQVTMDVYRGTAAANRTTAQHMSVIATAMGITAYAADVTALDALNSAVVGLYVNDSRTAMQAMDELAASINAFYYFDQLGQFRLGMLEGGMFLLSYTYMYEYDIIDIEQRGGEQSIPAWSMEYRYKNNETVQTSDIAGVVTPARRAEIGRPYKKVIVEDAPIKTYFLNARKLEVNSRMTTLADASTEASRIWNMFNYPTHIYEVTIPIEKFNFKLMDGIYLFCTRFDMSAGTQLAVIGYALNLSNNTAILTLWG